MSNFGRGGVRKFRRAASAVAVCGLLGAAYAAPADAAITGTNNPDTPGRGDHRHDGHGRRRSRARRHRTHRRPSATRRSRASRPAAPRSPSSPRATPTLADDPNDAAARERTTASTSTARGDANDPLTLAVPVTPFRQGPTACRSTTSSSRRNSRSSSTQGSTTGSSPSSASTSWTSAPNMFSAPLDFATSKGDAVSVDTVGPTTVTDVAAAGTTYDGATGVLTTKAQVAGRRAHAVPVDHRQRGLHLRLGSVRRQPPVHQRDAAGVPPPDIFAGDRGHRHAGQVPGVGKNALIPVFCGLPARDHDQLRRLDQPQREAAELRQEGRSR